MQIISYVKLSDLCRCIYPDKTERFTEDEYNHVKDIISKLFIGTDHEINRLNSNNFFLGAADFIDWSGNFIQITWSYNFFMEKLDSLSYIQSI